MHTLEVSPAAGARSGAMNPLHVALIAVLAVAIAKAILSRVAPGFAAYL